MNSKLKNLLIIVFILIVNISQSQNFDLSKHAIALSEITTFADNPGFKSEVIIKSPDNNVKWADEEGYIYTEDLEYINLFAYKVLYNSNNNIIVAVFYDSEGTATYSYIFDLTVSETSLKLNKTIGGGDRCHGAISINEIEVENEIMSYRSLITPKKFMNWFSNSDEALEFDDCMICCMGFADFKYDLNNHIKHFEGIQIIKENVQEYPLIKKTYDNFVKDRPLKLSLFLNEEELKDFINACK
jgi:hypothetical protein